ncbi:hypothetical protein VTK73DRAFT_5493 [Phialemonium thermophilum]|uniref:Uncharacterized protein n=1 Tax=Phialemonium thermophilum TaxID=223376 RepID=A0ABR3WNR9_9PEZI
MGTGCAVASPKPTISTSQRIGATTGQAGPRESLVPKCPTPSKRKSVCRKSDTHSPVSTASPMDLSWVANPFLMRNACPPSSLGNGTSDAMRGSDKLPLEFYSSPLSKQTHSSVAYAISGRRCAKSISFAVVSSADATKELSSPIEMGDVSWRSRGRSGLAAW